MRLKEQEEAYMTTRIYVVPFQCNFFPIYAESPIIKEGHKPVDYIELCEIYEIGQEYVFCPIQIYLTKNPLLYRIVGVIDFLQWDSDGNSYVELKYNNLRHYDMTIDGKVNMCVLTTDALEVEKSYGEQQILDLAVKNQKILSCRINTNASLPAKSSISRFDYSDMNFLYLQYHFKFSLLNHIEKDTAHISFDAGKIRYVHNLANGALSIDQDFASKTTGVIENFFTVAREIYRVRELPNRLYSLVESFFGFDKNSIKIKKFDVENNLLCFSVQHLFFKIHSDIMICNDNTDEELFHERALDEIIFYLQNSFRAYASKKWGFHDNCVDLQYKEFFKERLWESPVNFTVMKVHYYFDGERLQILYNENSTAEEKMLLLDSQDSPAIADYIEKNFGFFKTSVVIHFVNATEGIVEFSVHDIVYTMKQNKLFIKYDSSIYMDDYDAMEKRCWQQYISSQWGFARERIQIQKMDYKNRSFVFLYNDTYYSVQGNRLTII